MINGLKKSKCRYYTFCAKQTDNWTCYGGSWSWIDSIRLRTPTKGLIFGK